jgi:hypothetical protein
MSNPERKILVLDSDRTGPHPESICPEALRLRNEILLKEDLNHGRAPIGICTRRKGGINGCLIEIIPQESQKKSEK